ncbi:MAG: 3-hydroxyacyl-CoA dehydrogenase, partial [Gammaproteobacteria bacterium]|nr:3-hydroxyacyl-CoA dehydrogenase [Gammaproteobacteria bacterium]
LDAKRLHFFHQMFHGESNELLATTEQMLLHVDMSEAKASAIDAPVFNVLENIWNEHQKLSSPKQQGRVMHIPNNK